MRLAPCIIILLSCLLSASAQSISTTPPLVASGSVSPNVFGPTPSSTAHSLTALPALPSGKTTLLGGTISSIDQIRDQIVLDVFGGGRYVILFDERTRVFDQARRGSLDSLRRGERAYIDTMLDGTAIFARNIRVSTATPSGQASGQIVNFDSGNRELVLRDGLDPRSVKLRLMPGAAILRDGRPAQTADLRSGTLVNVLFVPGVGGKGSVQQVSILASPGEAFVFSGQLQFLDLRGGRLVIVDPRDNRSYELYFDAGVNPQLRNLQEGSSVTASTSFDGRRYLVRSITLNTSSSQSR